MSVIYFTNNSNSGDGSLRQALLDAVDGDVVEPDPSVFGVGELVSVAVSSPLEANSAATLRSGAARLRLSRTAAAGQTLFNVNADLTVEDVEFVGRVYVYATNATFRRCFFGGNAASVDLIRATANYGVALYDCVVVGALGSGIYAPGSATIVRSTVAGNASNCVLPNDATVVDSLVDRTSSTVGFVAPPPDTIPTDQGALPWDEWDLRLLSSSTYATGATTASGEYDCDGNPRGRVVPAEGNNASVYALGAYEVVDADYFPASVNTISFNDPSDWRLADGSTPQAIAAGVFYLDKNATLYDAAPSGSKVQVEGRRRVALSAAQTLAALGVGRNATLDISSSAIASSLSLATGATVLLGGTDSFLTATAAIERDSGATVVGATKGYFATPSGATGATLSNAVVCQYGAGASDLTSANGGVSWSATNPSIGVLVERRNGSAWTTVAASATSLATKFQNGTVVRIFDGAQFLSTTVVARPPFWRITDWATIVADGDDERLPFAATGWAVDPETMED